ncbi:MAG TPA: hypothetical protein VHV82_22855 [Sporichthyaceae bacterium]|nr:hypothetical protein [Sporichthyaceae bacterium]
MQITGVTIEHGLQVGDATVCTSGTCDGAGILNHDGALELTNSVPNHNGCFSPTGSCAGGGIYSAGPLTLTGTTVSSDVALMSGPQL